MPSLVLSSVGLSADRVPLPGSYLLQESPQPMIEEKKQPPPPPVMAEAVRKRSLFYLKEDQPEDSSSETSSIGAAHEDEDEEEGEAVESKKGEDGGAFDSFDSLEDSLSIKRGLSRFFSGKSRSFANILSIASATKVNVLAKPENPLNKRRRLARRAHPPLLSPNEEVEEENAINGNPVVSVPSLLIH